MEQYLWLIPLGFVVGAYGTLIGAGGGFVLVPALLLLYPAKSPEVITSISLAVVFVNALSGSLAYARLGRIDYRSGLLFSAATVPGAVLGVLTTAYVPRRLFAAAFGLLILTASVFLMLRPTPKTAKNRTASRGLSRCLVEADGTSHSFSYNPRIGVGLSLVVGYVSSLLGIGGGIIHVPALAYLLNFPVHIATATSHFILAVTALTGTSVHLARGTLQQGASAAVPLAIGVLLGAQVGAVISCRTQNTWIIRGLALALGFVGIRTLIMAL